MSIRYFPGFSIIVALWAALLITPVAAQPIPGGTPDKQGMSSDRLKRITNLADRYVADGKVPGITVVVMRNGRIIHDYAAGTYGIENNTPMDANTIVRIYSMSKPIVAVALMTLYEEGRFSLLDPVSKYLPELKDLKVLTADGTLVDPRTPPNMQQLLSHTAGFSYGFTDSPIDQQYQAARLFTAANTDELVAGVARLPLAFNPGDRWNYSIASDLVGVVIERISGQNLEAFLQKRLFVPLDMRDTSFNVTLEKRSRLAQNHSIDPQTGALMVSKTMDGITVPAVDATLYSGGGGLYSTTRDYVRFVAMLRNGGQLNGTRILSPKTIGYMTLNHVQKSSAAGAGEAPVVNITGARGLGFGLGFGVLLDPVAAGSMGSVGEYSWGGAAGTIFWIDPQEDIAVISMIQLMLSPWPLRQDLRVLTNAAITKLATGN